MARNRVRPLFVLVLLIGLLVLLPLLFVYHFFTFDFERISSSQRRFHSTSLSIASLPACLAIDSAEFLRSDVQPSLQARCGVKNTTSFENLQRKLRLVHFVNVALDAVPNLDEEQVVEGKEQFTYLQFAAVQSIRRAMKPDVMMMHYLETPRGVWYTQCQRHLGLHQVLPPVLFNTRPPTLNRHQRRQIWEVLIMLRALKKHGGIAFSDFNTILFRKLGVDMAEDMVIASQANSRKGAFWVGLHVMQSPPGHPFVEFLEQSIVELVEKNDARLHQMQLEEVVGQIVLNKYLEEQQNMLRNTNTSDPATSKRSIIMDGVVIGTPNLFEFDGLHDLLHGKLEPSLIGQFRDVAGIHVDKYDFGRMTDTTNDIREITRMQHELNVAEDWLKLETLLGAVLRLVLTANISAELDVAFT